MKRKIFIIIVIVLVALPLLLNFILSLETPFNAPVLGKGPDWLLFWGSYLGGILTAAIGFATLYYMIEHNKSQEIEQFRDAQARELQNELIKRVSSLNYNSIGRILPRLVNGVSKDEIVRELCSLVDKYDRVNMDGLSWCMMSWHDIVSKPKDFDKQYVIQIELFKSDINNVIDVLEDYDKNGEVNSQKIAKMQTIISEHSLGLIESLVKPARKWIEEETGL